MQKRVLIAIGFLLIISPATLFAQLTSDRNDVFKVRKAKGEIVIDGKINEKDWGFSEKCSLDHFKNIEKESDKQATIFRALWDEENLYIFFECTDQFITAREKARDGQPYFDDCAEIFLIPAPEGIDMHLGFEVNLFMASNDFIYLNEIYQGKHAVLKSFDPDFEVGIEVNGTLNDNSDFDTGWSMEMAIPLKLFVGRNTFVEVKDGAQWTFLAVRQDRNDADGNRRSTSTIFPLYGDNVHEPKRFGKMEFVE